MHKGRQIDGSLTVSGTTYLVELKFTAGPADANDIDSFYKKITSKADNTMGVMVSISGYSSVAKQEASGERTLIPASRSQSSVHGSWRNHGIGRSGGQSAPSCLTDRVGVLGGGRFQRVKMPDATGGPAAVGA